MENANASPLNMNVVWAIVSGLAIGYIAGNVMPIHDGSSSAAISRAKDPNWGAASASPAAAQRQVAPSLPQAPPPPKWSKMPLADWTPVMGPKYAKVTVITFSDFECPFCAGVLPTLKQITDTYGKDVRIAWRNAPAPFHPHATEAAEAAMAANAQGKFWQMHDKLFATQGTLDREHLDGDAKEIGLDMTKYRADMDHHTFLADIREDTRVGVAAGLNGTPTFFINGQYLFGKHEFEDLKVVIDAELAKANTLVAAGTPLEKLYDAELAALPTTPAANAPQGSPLSGGAPADSAH